MPHAKNTNENAKIITNTRVIDAERTAIFAAFTDPARLAAWWGPKGFTNSFHAFEFAVGGAWRYTMHGPDGKDYENESVFRECSPARIEIEHLRPMHHFTIVISLAEQEEKTALTWTMLFDEPVDAKLRAFITNANEENIDRLQELVLAHTEMTNREIIITRLINAERERVWKAFTKPEALARWWGPTGFSLTTTKFAFRERGQWRFTMHGPDGRDYPNLVRFTKIIPNALMSHEHYGEDDVLAFHTDITLEDVDGKTLVTFRLVLPTAQARAKEVKEHNAIEGGNQTLGRLAAYTEQN